MSLNSHVRLTLAALLVPMPGVAPQTSGDSLTNAGVVRATAVVDSVFVDRTVSQGFVAGGDWGSYLMARLGVIPIPDDLQLRVTVDTTRLVLHGRIADLPLEARRALGPLLGMFPPQTRIAADIELTKVAREVVRFRLTAARVNDTPLPETLVAGVLAEVGRQYPALSRTGRDLFVQIPADAEVTLVVGGVRLRAPHEPAPASTPGQ